jgi:hypothetical protein
MSYIGTIAPPASVRTSIRKAVFDRKIGDLILKLDRVVDHIPPDDLGGANEAHAIIDELVDFLEWLRRM